MFLVCGLDINGKYTEIKEYTSNMDKVYNSIYKNLGNFYQINVVDDLGKTEMQFIRGKKVFPN